jgi:hypothetical protein
MFCHSNNFASKGHPPTSKQSKIAFNLFAYPPRKRAKPGQKRARPFSLALFFFIFFYYYYYYYYYEKDRQSPPINNIYIVNKNSLKSARLPAINFFGNLLLS